MPVLEHTESLSKLHLLRDLYEYINCQYCNTQKQNKSNFHSVNCRISCKPHELHMQYRLICYNVTFILSTFNRLVGVVILCPVTV